MEIIGLTLLIVLGISFILLCLSYLLRSVNSFLEIFNWNLSLPGSVSLMLFKLKEHFLFAINKADLHKVEDTLSKYFPFYQQLSFEQQKKFAKRVLVFASCRHFVFSKRYTTEDQMAYLISANAIQLSFGLDQYLLAHFKKVYVFEKAYQHISSEFLFQGHIQHGEIHFSWQDLHLGFTHSNDKNNVGLHEMAHALTYESFHLGGRGDRHFRKTFHHYSAIARPLFKQIQNTHSHFFGSYAATNYEEFWAVSVEAFFEQPTEMDRLYPQLYQVMVELLRQDPGIVFNSKIICK